MGGKINLSISGAQRIHNIRTKARMISSKVWREEGWGVCTGDLERDFTIAELDRLRTALSVSSTATKGE